MNEEDMWAQKYFIEKLEQEVTLRNWIRVSKYACPVEDSYLMDRGWQYCPVHNIGGACTEAGDDPLQGS